MMNSGRLVLGLALVASLALTGCAGKVRLASSKSCAAHGGTYNATSRTCTTQVATKSAQQICQEGGGWY